MTGSKPDGLLPSGTEVAVSQIGEGLGGQTPPEGKRLPGRTLTATIVVVGPHARLVDAADAVEHVTNIGVRAIVISTGTDPAPTVKVRDHTVTLEGLRP